VLNNLSEQIRDCLLHAEECARKAAELPNSSRFRQDFLQLEKRWLELARSIEFGESVDRFTKNSRRAAASRRPGQSEEQAAHGLNVRHRARRWKSER
jgi:hypothetical protein